MCLKLAIPWNVWQTAPPEIRLYGRTCVYFYPVSFVVGINELQVFAERFFRLFIIVLNF